MSCNEAEQRSGCCRSCQAWSRSQGWRPSVQSIPSWSELCSSHTVLALLLCPRAGSANQHPTKQQPPAAVRTCRGRPADTACDADNERRLARKCAELSSQAVEASAKAQTAQVLGAKDSKTIATLKEEVDRAWAALESSHQKARSRGPLFGIST